MRAISWSCDSRCLEGRWWEVRRWSRYSCRQTNWPGGGWDGQEISELVNLVVDWVPPLLAGAFSGLVGRVIAANKVWVNSLYLVEYYTCKSRYTNQWMFSKFVKSYFWVNWEKHSGRQWEGRMVWAHDIQCWLSQSPTGEPQVTWPPLGFHWVDWSHVRPLIL